MKCSELHFGEIPFYLVLCTGRLIILNSKTSEFKCRSAKRKIYCINFTLLSTYVYTEKRILCSDQEMVLTFKKKWCIDFLILSIILPGKHNCYFENNDVNWYITCRYLTTSTMCGSRFFFGEGVWTSSPHPPPRPPPPVLIHACQFLVACIYYAIEIGMCFLILLTNTYWHRHLTLYIFLVIKNIDPLPCNT